MSFIDDCLSGVTSPDKIDTYIKQWSDGEKGLNQELHEYLGMTWEEYSIWGTQPSSLSSILRSRNSNTTHVE